MTAADPTSPAPAPVPASGDGGDAAPGRPRRRRGGRGRRPAGETRGAEQRGPDERPDARPERRPDADRRAPDRPRSQDPRRGREARARRLAALADARRAVAVPPVVYPEQLPVSARREEIAAAIRDHQVVIVAGETGSGKTTQLPKIALELGRGRDGQIGHTQPRRIAARTVAERIAEELGTTIGELVGYQVRFTDESSDRTLVKVMTDGILLAQIQRDPELRAYDTLIIDEAHERSLNIDFILGYLAQLLPRRPDLKVVITSATIDSARFAAHFAGPADAEHPDGVPAPVVEVTGRTYPVEIRYRPLSPDRPTDDPDDLDADDGARPRAGSRGAAAKGTKAPPPAEDRDLMTAICEAVDELTREGPGDVLVFFSGEREIRDAEEALRGHLGPRVQDARRPDAVELLPLYGRLSAAEQHRVFQQHSTRRVVLATNVAETSLTVPGIRYVVDPGTARISRYSKATKVQRLPIEPISQASANQRSGRCGRVADGIAIRLYSEDDFASRPRFTEPEILRTSLASVILQMVAVGVATGPDDVASFPFVDPPDTRAVRDGVQLLTELGALETGSSGTRLTDTGRALAQLPMDPRLARMIVEGGRRGVAREVMIVAAALSIQDPRERPVEQRAQADQLHARFADPSSDFLAYLNLWQYVRDAQRDLSSSAFRRLCRAEYLNFLRLREWQDVVTQLKELAKPLGITMNPPRQTDRDLSEERDPATEGRGAHRLEWDADRVHVALLSGLLSQIGMQEASDLSGASTPARGKGRDGGRAPDRRGRNEYLGARGAKFAIFPGSGLAKKPPAWVMAGELVETSRLWARDAARIQPEWAEDLAQHLVKRSYSEPSWSSKQGAAMALERVMLYGVPIVTGRRVLFGKVDAEHARELFIRHALVEGDWTTHHAFFAENRRLLQEAEDLEARSRRRGLVVDDDALFAFYDERIPDDVVSARHFDQWWKGARRREPDLLSFTRELLVADDGGVDESSFPSTWPQGDLALPLTYQFQPGADADGVTVHVPLVALARVRPEGFDWMVPGLREELVTATIRALPKPVRVQLVPAPDVARDVVGWLDAHTASWEDTVRAADAAPSYETAFRQAVRALRDVVVPDGAVDLDRLPPHLRMTFRVVDDRGRVLDEGKELVALQRRLAARTQDAVSSAVRTAVRDAMADARARSGPAPHGAGDPAPARGGAAVPGPGSRPATAALPGFDGADLDTWPADLPGGALPERVETQDASGLTVRGYPALVEHGTGPAATVRVEVLADAGEQAVQHRRGLSRLLVRDVGLAAGRVTSRWTGTQALTLAASPYPSTEALVADVQLAAVDRLLTEHLAGRPATAVRSADAYAAARGFVRDRLEDAVHRVVQDLVAVLATARELDGAVRDTRSLALLGTVRDVREQGERLVHDGFVSETGAERLPHLARYLRAAAHRLDKAAGNLARDEQLAWQVRDLEQLLGQTCARVTSRTPVPADLAALDEVRWLLEELRVSLFAQQLGTPVPVSEKRIRKALSALA
ncbi:ATP-dependent RNA helicase HrpA [Cellulomonas pakistanensis]|uniref:ATP-dependent helicase HrpA n=1 Tax=Cellulomonas pakistanensis TaxID=992287 RepID=A0A919P5T7_9CELL|nr:ATP-dependent RNA helicase HrpA [Cellulomonas pakistanensis]GIG34874.1 ATP-dependent helicase HrpA [Cellulomonas pakistanensis]